GIGVAGADGQSLRVTLPVGAAERGVPVRDGAVAHDNGDGSVTVPIPKSDGSVQVLTVIESESAPPAYRYELGITVDARVEQGENGAIAIVSEAGELIAGISEPWAVDAHGAPVPTTYELEGATLIQHVDHAGYA